MTSSLGSLAGLGLAAVVIAAIVVSQRGSFVATPGTDGSVASGAAAAARPTDTNAGTSAPAASPSGGTTVASLRSVGSGHLMGATWAPDGQHVVVYAQGSTASTPTVQHILDAQGIEVATITADSLVWTGPDTYLVTRRDGSGAERQSTARLGATGETSVAPGSVPVPSTGPVWCASVAMGSATLRPGGDTAAPVLAEPLACSPDGRTAAILQVTQEGIAAGGWLQIVDTSSGTVIRDLRGTHIWDRGAWIAFSPDGTALGFTDDPSVYVVEIASGTVTTVQTATGGGRSVTPAWLPDGRLAVPDPSASTVRAFTLDGTASPTDIPYGPDLSISSSGAALAMDDLSHVLGVRSTDGRGSLDLTSCTPNGSQAVSWSPEGSHAILVCTNLQPTSAGGDYDEQALLVSFP